MGFKGAPIMDKFEWLQGKRAYGWVILIAVLINAGFLMLLPADWKVIQSTDYLNYYRPAALNLVAGNGLVTQGQSYLTVYPPGFPLILSGIFFLSQVSRLDEALLLAGFNLLWMGLSTALLFWITDHLAGREGAWITACLWCTYPFALWLTIQPLNEMPFLVFLYLAVALFLKGQSASRRSLLFLTLSGIAAGLAMLIRPIAIGLPLLFAGAALFLPSHDKSGARLSGAAILLLACLLIILPWEIQLTRLTERILPLSSNGTQAIQDGLAYAIDNNTQVLPLPEPVVPVMKEIAQAAYSGEMDSIRQIYGVVIYEFKHRPVGVLQLLGVKLLRSWYGTDSGRMEQVSGFLQFGFYLPVSLWALIYGWIKKVDARRYLLFLVVLYFWGMTFSALSILRYMVPAMGFLFCIIGISFTAGFKESH